MKVISLVFVVVGAMLLLVGCGHSMAWQNGYDYGTNNISNFETFGIGGPKAWCERSVAAANASTVQQLKDWLAGCEEAAGSNN